METLSLRDELAVIEEDTFEIAELTDGSQAFGSCSTSCSVSSTSCTSSSSCTTA